MMGSEQLICKCCRWSDDTERKNSGLEYWPLECRKHSPVAGEAFPTVDDDDWCGDWKEKLNQPIQNRGE